MGKFRLWKKYFITYVNGIWTKEVGFEIYFVYVGSSPFTIKWGYLTYKSILNRKRKIKIFSYKIFRTRAWRIGEKLLNRNCWLVKMAKQPIDYTRVSYTQTNLTINSTTRNNIRISYPHLEYNLLGRICDQARIFRASIKKRKNVKMKCSSPRTRIVNGG